MLINGKAIAEQVIVTLEHERPSLGAIKLGVLMTEGDAVTESYVRIKARVAERLGVEIVRRELSADASTDDAVQAIQQLVQETHGVIVQMPLAQSIALDGVLVAVPASHDVDAIRPEPPRPPFRAPVAEAIAEIFVHAQVSAAGKKAVVVGAGRLVGAPATELLKDLGAEVTVVTDTQGSLRDLKDADIVVLGAGKPALVQPEMLKEGVVLIDAGTSNPPTGASRVVGDADPRCAEVASVFTPVPGGVGPIAVAMLFKNLFALVKKNASR
jgi:methylenetetrahydrofolate dehydrogenase (NADP+) / methenyltetrahydrofolate cyclohydrolase